MGLLRLPLRTEKTELLRQDKGTVAGSAQAGAGRAHTRFTQRAGRERRERRPLQTDGWRG